MKYLTVTQPLGWIMHITGNPGAGKTTTIGDMLHSEMAHGKCAYLFTKQEGNEKQGAWSVLPHEVLANENCDCILLEKIGDLDELISQWVKNPLVALGLDTSTGLESLIKAFITGSPTTELKTSTKDFQHKKFQSKLAYYLAVFRDIARYTMMVSPAMATTYNPERGQNDVGLSGSPMDAEKRLSPAGENQKSIDKLMYGCDYAFHIERNASSHTGNISGYTLRMQPSLRLNTKNRLQPGRKLTDIELSATVGENWPKIKQSIESTFGGAL
jgi:hypothetical protein